MVHTLPSCVPRDAQPETCAAKRLFQICIRLQGLIDLFDRKLVCRTRLFGKSKIILASALLAIVTLRKLFLTASILSTGTTDFRPIFLFTIACCINLTIFYAARCIAQQQRHEERITYMWGGQQLEQQIFCSSSFGRRASLCEDADCCDLHNLHQL